MNILVCGHVHVHMLYVSESAYSKCVSVPVEVEGLWQGYWRRYKYVSKCVNEGEWVRVCATLA